MLLQCSGSCLKGIQGKCLRQSLIIGMKDQFEAKQVIGNDFNTCISMAEDNSLDEASEEEERTETKEEWLLRVMDIRERVRSGNVRRNVNRAEND